MSPATRGRVVRLVAVAALVVAWSAAAQPTPTPPPELRQVRAQIRDLEARLAGLEAQQSDLAGQRERLEGELRLAALRLGEWESELGRAEGGVAAAVREAEAARASLDVALHRLRLQITLLAVLGRSGLSPLVLYAVGSGRDVQDRITVTLALVEEERRRRDEVARLTDARTHSLSLLSQRRQELEGMRGEGIKRRQELESTRGRVLAELGRLERERRTQAVALAGAQEAEARLERLWGNVTERDEKHSASVRLARGGLPWPVRGAEVIERFGARRDRQYGTVTMSHGLVLRAPSGTQALSVAAGRVAYAQFFKGYGNLVIVNHGGDIYSLYARLSSMLVRAGDRVGMADPVGMLGPSGDGGGNLYLEIRVGKQSQDPLGWLQPAGK